MADDHEERERSKRLKKHYAKQQRIKNRSAVREGSKKSKALPVGAVRKKISADEKKANLVATLDVTKLGDSFVLAQIDDLFIGCSSCKSSVRHIMNRWDINEDPETLMPKIDRVATTVYKKQTVKQQMNMTVKEVAVVIIKHIEAFRQRNLITLESTNEERESIAERRAETVDAASFRSVELAPAQRS